ncbi:DUF6185 family protein [Streptomyces sp. NPDC049555]|uniref:DUF6185 family protein n=1 Tax=Streptomyces sp. NPDC049555 TaxID=3154930 RepID=UPI00341202C2
MTTGARAHRRRRTGRCHGPARRGAWQRCALLLACLICWWGGLSGASPAAAAVRAPAADDCHTTQLAATHTQVRLRLENRARTVPQATGLMTVRVPAGWMYADDLLLGEESEDYRHAMRCLLRGPTTMQRPEEWRPHSPRVQAETSWVEVRYETLFRFHAGGHFFIGPWAMDVGNSTWGLQLAVPPALTAAYWDRVEIDLGGLGTAAVTPKPATAGSGHLVWTGLHGSAGHAPVVTVKVTPPWQRAWTAINTNSEPWLVANAAGMTTWWVGTSIVLVLAALRALRQPAGPQLSDLEHSSSTALWRWGVLKAALGVMILLLYKVIVDAVHAAVSRPPDWLGFTMRWPVLIGAVAGWLLVVTARPKRSVLVASSAVAAVAVAVTVTPPLLGLAPQMTVPRHPSDTSGFVVLVVLDAALQWLWLVGFVVWAWHLAHQGGLLPPSARPWRLRRLGPALVVVIALLQVWAVWVLERKWQRTTWLAAHNVASYHTQHLAALDRDVASYAAQIPTWYYTHTWVLTGLAIVALLRARDLAPATPFASPAPLDRLLLAVFFAVVVAWRQGSYAGSQAFAAIWLVLDIAALYGLLAVGQRRSVLTQHFEGCSGDCSPQLCETITEAERDELIARARRYRELTAALRVMEQQGGEGALGRHALEKELSRLHRWRPTSDTDAARPWLPFQVTVVDVALSWGPHAKWWDNARHAAVLAAAFGLPGSILMVWMAYSPEPQWEQRGVYLFGAPEMLFMFVYWELVWAGAGLVLGALWRLLPGRRGPARAFALTVAYTLLIALGIVGSLITNQEIGNVAVAISLMLLVLTLTSLAMDADTFRSERRFWPNRMALLLSIYQIRSFSAQVAYILMQLVAVLTILKFFAGGEIRFK